MNTHPALEANPQKNLLCLRVYINLSHSQNENCLINAENQHIWKKFFSGFTILIRSTTSLTSRAGPQLAECRPPAAATQPAAEVPQPATATP